MLKMTASSIEKLTLLPDLSNVARTPPSPAPRPKSVKSKESTTRLNTETLPTVAQRKELFGSCAWALFHLAKLTLEDPWLSQAAMSHATDASGAGVSMEVAITSICWL